MSTQALTEATQVSINEQVAKERVFALDLSAIAFKLVNPEEGQGLTHQEAERGINLYRQYLVVVSLHPGTPIVPTKEIDKVWHTHILDTVKYMADCQFLFGSYLHHFPYLGLRGEEDAKELQRLFEVSCLLFVRYFGTAPNAVAGDCSSTCDGGGCGGCDDNISIISSLTPEQILNGSDPINGKYIDGKDRPQLV